MKDTEATTWRRSSYPSASSEGAHLPAARRKRVDREGATSEASTSDSASARRTSRALLSLSFGIRPERALHRGLDRPLGSHVQLLPSAVSASWARRVSRGSDRRSSRLRFASRANTPDNVLGSI